MLPAASECPTVADRAGGAGVAASHHVLVRWIGHCGMALDRPAGAPDRARLDLALSLGLDMLELDVAVCGSGELVLMHDLEVAGGVAVEEAGLEELRRSVPGLLSLDAGLEHLAGRVPVLLDIKGRSAGPLAARLAADGHPGDLAVCAEAAGDLLRLRYVAPRVARWRSLPLMGEGRGAGRRRIAGALRRSTLARDLGWLTAEVGAAGVCVDRWAVSPALGRACAAHRMEFDAWTVNDPHSAARMDRCGVGLITSDLVPSLRSQLAS